MGKCEVTWDEVDVYLYQRDMRWRASKHFRPATPRDILADFLIRPSELSYADLSFGMGKAGRPVVCLTQVTAKAYCRWLSAMTGRYYRLPTEAEWEYACRAGSQTAYSFGDAPKQLGEYAWFADNSDEKYHRVGLKKPNRWGLHDMHGNVAEWVLDQYEPEFYRRSLEKGDKRPFADPKAIYPRIVRGGSWQDDPDELRSAARRASNKDWSMQDPQIPQSRWYHTDASFVGFRVVRPLRVPSLKECDRLEGLNRDLELHRKMWESKSGPEAEKPKS
jgi:formylglycine-generating enzyme required for sulfatase activity